MVAVKPNIDPKKVSSRVAQGLKNAAAGAATGNGYVAVGALACGLFDCGAAVAALVDWGVDRIQVNDSGINAETAPNTAGLDTSDGYYWRPMIQDGGLFLSPSAACNSASYGGRLLGIDGTGNSRNCKIQRAGGYDTFLITIVRQTVSGCKSGSFVVGGACKSRDELPKQYVPMETYLQSNYTGKGWNHHWAKMTAEIVKNDGNVFTDGTSVGITGPAIIPLSESTAKTGVQLLPGTTTPAPSGHTGPTDSGTQTTTTTTSAHNKFNPAPFTSSSSGSSGGPASGPSMTTTQTTTTTTSITNNITNITNITNETTTEKDEAPEESATDTPLSKIPELYKQKYPDGFAGVWSSFKTNISQTSFVRLISELTPNIGSGGSCPVWTFDLGFIPGASMGVHRLGAEYCFIWPILKIILMITALFTARRLIFGG